MADSNVINIEWGDMRRWVSIQVLPETKAQKQLYFFTKTIIGFQKSTYFSQEAIQLLSVCAIVTDSTLVIH
ncbi:hypothetical protein [Prevotella corporis]|uniref:Uncharacterized protein n=1 Tax=Prevotella corporis TaxID=28128 RepID=A0A133QCZ3_9BACT|nr:hypothetical protein [Prevotella corporis]KXA40739.1 hypothetical protein HMPREF3226_00999 [Prevotella corporis]